LAAIRATSVNDLLLLCFIIAVYNLAFMCVSFFRLLHYIHSLIYVKEMLGGLSKITVKNDSQLLEHRISYNKCELPQVLFSCHLQNQFLLM
jgi:hypothetical protein